MRRRNGHRSALSSLNRWKGRGILAQRGFPNLALARAAKAKKREQRLRLERIEAAKRFSPSRCSTTCRRMTIWSIL
jgi:hypothetical protein